MKKFVLTPFLLVILLGITLLSSCDSDDPAPEITAPEGKIAATIDGVYFEADGGGQIYNDEIMLGGNSGDQSLSIIITQAAAVGTYEAKGVPLLTTPDAQINYTPDGQTLFSSSFAANGEVAGTIKITEIDETNKTISGTFSSKVVVDGNTKEIVSGSFNKIPYATVAPGTMSAVVEGVDFDATVVIAQRAQGLIAVNGQALNGSKMLVLYFDDAITVGTHSIGDVFDDTYAMYTASGSSMVSTGGTLKITKHDTSAKRVEGTFSFEAEPFLGEGAGITISGGSFAVNY